ncbi:hypothetical protein [Microbulbifer aestuariivivens]|uniref:hypothetical protein n=1 Tax=Microbulbifer aestuariivivens TaxID=1908308 RepID=UPI0031E85E79
MKIQLKDGKMERWKDGKRQKRQRKDREKEAVGNPFYPFVSVGVSELYSLD